MVNGTFKCYTHEIGFEDLDDYRDHNASEVHTHTGIAPCNQCGLSTEYVFTGKLAKDKYPALCKTCKAEIVEGLN